jgi:beta-1,4-mannosyl-glycoprotein beta-1,4-N-acetylglucosaminyltransferase
LKLQTFAHTEYATKKFSNIKIIKKKISSLEDLFNKNLKYEKIICDKSYPQYILRNIKKFKNWII